MGYGRSESWLWRCVLVAAVCICGLNIIVLLGGERRMKEEVSVQRMKHSSSEKLIINKPESAAKRVHNHDKRVLYVSHRVVKDNDFISNHESHHSTNNINIPLSLKKPVWLDVVNVEKFLHPSETLLLGRPKDKKAYLVIGVPTVFRKKANYLLDTIKGLVTNLSEQERDEVIIVVFVADFSSSYREWVKSNILQHWEKEVESGLIQVIVAPKAFYPDMHNLPPLYGDRPDRIQWRSKQSLDYSFMYYYCSDLSEYYVQVEDDILVEENYLKHMKDYIRMKGTNWSTLEFGARGFIGMLYKSKNLIKLARFCRLYFWTMPVDWLFRVFNDVHLYGNTKKNAYKPPLFKHVGAFSSLDGQTRKLEDLRGNRGMSEKIPRKHQQKENPPASLSTTIEGYVVPHSIEGPYGAKGYYWGKKIHVGDTIDIMLEEAVALSKIVIASGSKRYPDDRLQDSELLVSEESDEGHCSDYVSVGMFIDSGTVIHSFKKKQTVKCVQLKIVTVREDRQKRARWLLISEIALTVA